MIFKVKGQGNVTFDLVTMIWQTALIHKMKAFVYLSCSGKYNENYVLNHEKSIVCFFGGEKSGMDSLTSTKTCMNPTKIREATHSPEIIQ